MKKEAIKEKILSILKDKYNLTFFIILIIAFSIRLYFFFLTKNQALWWDEAEYLAKSKSIAFGIPATSWWIGRPILFSLIGALFFKAGLGETGVRILFIFLSCASILLIYLIGKDLFNKKIALIASFILTFFYLDLFYTSRLLVDMPQIFFILLSFYFILQGYILKKNEKMLWFFIPILTIGILLRFTVGIFLIIIFLFLFLTEGFKFIKNKNFWISGGIGLVFYLPYWIWSYFKFNSLNPFYVIFYVLGTTIEDRTSSAFNVFMQYIKYFPSYTGYLLFFCFLIGLIILIFEFVISIDLIKKQDYVKYRLLILLWIIIPIIYFGFFVNHFEDRYIFMIFPAVFLVLGYGIEKIHVFIEKFNKPIAVACILILLFYGAYQMYNQSSSIINDKLASYKDIKTAGLWINKNSNPGDIVISHAIPMINYYSQRDVYEIKPNETSQFEFIKNKKPKYLVISNWQNSPQWISDYVSQDQSKFTLVYSATSDYKGQKTYAYVFSIN